VEFGSLADSILERYAGIAARAYLDEIARLRRAGADGVILGCTEITMLVGQADLDLPVFDTTRIHAEAAIDFATGASS
jgi:aspartate racemase